MDVELADLAAIVALPATLHFRRPPDPPHVSHPALTNRIRKLAGRIGGRRLMRRSRDVRLPEAGRRLGEHGRARLRESEATVTLSQRAARGEAGRLRVGFGIPSTPALLPPVLLRFRRAYP